MKFSISISIPTSTLSAFVLCLILVHYTSSNRVSMDLISGTFPTELEIAIGSTSNITCVINSRYKGINSTSLSFIQEDTTQTVQQDDIVILNKKKIVYMIRNASEQSRVYICKSVNDTVGRTHVAVGTKPLPVIDFKCRGYDFLYMECSFTMPHNTIKPTYELNFTVMDSNYIHRCDLKIVDNTVICNLTEESSYRNGYQFYDFTLRGINSLGIKEQSIMVDHYKSVVPASPDFKVENIQINSANLVWQMRNYYLYRRKSKLQYKVRLHPHNFDWFNYNQYNLTRENDSFSLELNKLPYAYYNYTVSLRLRVNASAGDDSMWSPAVIRTFRTKPCLPKAPPKTAAGSFYINYINSTATHVRLYWQKLHAYEENGPNFNYVIKEVQSKGVKINLTLIEIDRTSALFEWHNKNPYKFIIKSKNSVGESLTSSEIIVPRLKSIILEDISPKWIWGTYTSENQTYTLTWKPPANMDNLEDYTVYWCSGKMNTNTECTNNIEFEHVKKTDTKYIKTTSNNDTLNFAVSANYKNSTTTGMHWMLCSPDVSSDLDTMTPKIIPLSTTSINIEWAWDNICPSILEGYNITYCQVENETENYGCAIGTITTVLINNTAKSYELQNLKPYTKYMITMYMYSKKKEGKISEAQFLVTKEIENIKSLSFLIIINILMVIIIVILVTCAIFINRKYRDMRDIKVVLPAGIENYNFMERDGDLNKGQQQKMQKQDFLPSSEYFHLLAKTNNDSGDISNDVNLLQTPQCVDVNFMHTNEYIKDDVSFAKIMDTNASHITHANYMIMEKQNITAPNEVYTEGITLPSSTQHPTKSDVPTSDYIMPNLKTNSDNSYVHQFPCHSASNYVKPNDIRLSEGNDDYLSSQMLLKPRINSSYTTLDALNKTTSGIHKIKSSPTSLVELESSALSGYVTQKELFAIH